MFSRLISFNLLKNVENINKTSSFNLLHTSHICQKKKKSKSTGKAKKIKSGKNVAVVVCGCGALDGTEISEAISLAIHISEQGMEPRFFAPDVTICGSVNHLTTDLYEPVEFRNALAEGARIARASIKPLTDCTPSGYAALIIPGGWGAARTLSDFASKGCNCIVNPDLIKVIEDFNCEKKPIGAICISAAIAAKVLPGAKVTLGKDCPEDQWPYAEAISKVREMGGNIEMQDVRGVSHCTQHNLFSTPAWMDTKATYADIHAGIGKLVSMIKKTIEK